MVIVDESEVKEVQLPGRFMKKILSPALCGTEQLSLCLIRIPGNRSVGKGSFHAHPRGEEAVYILEGEGLATVDGKASRVKAGSVILFPRGSLHLLENAGASDLRALCFFAPPADPEDAGTYRILDGEQE